MHCIHDTVAAMHSLLNAIYAIADKHDLAEKALRFPLTRTKKLLVFSKRLIKTTCFPKNKSGKEYQLLSLDDMAHMLGGTPGKLAKRDYSFCHAVEVKHNHAKSSPSLQGLQCQTAQEVIPFSVPLRVHPEGHAHKVQAVGAPRL